jgi:hypothetical protein
VVTHLFVSRLYWKQSGNKIDVEGHSIAGQFNNEQIGNFVKADTYGEAAEL